MRPAESMAHLPKDRLPRPPYAHPILPIHRSLAAVPPAYDVDRYRKESLSRIAPFTKKLLADPSVEVSDVQIPGPRQPLTATVVRPADGPRGDQPGIVYFHGGAMIASNRYAGLDTSVVWAREFGAVTVSVEYGLAPEHPAPQPTEDCYATLRWVAANLAELGIDPDRLMLYGVSAGGGLAAATALLARDKGVGPKLCGLFLECPMLDDRNGTVSQQQFAHGPFYGSIMNNVAWRCVLGDRVGTADVTEYEAPARASDLSGLPPVFLDCASAEPFRDEIVAFALKLWEDGIAAELHVWPGGPHGYDRMAPKMTISVQAHQVRLLWMRKALTKASEVRRMMM
ncbi:lipase [Xylariaceae sp. FL0804]|nr:lipase [Xylariaceae sp. FL0804]